MVVKVEIYNILFFKMILVLLGNRFLKIDFEYVVCYV